MYKIISKILLYVSIIFLLIYLSSNDMLVFPEILSTEKFILSIVFVQIGFLVSMIMKKILYSKVSNKISYKHILESEYLTIFNKYIPGKVFVIVGPVAYLKSIYTCFTVKELSYWAVILQLITVTSALLIGLITYGHYLVLSLYISYILLIGLLILLIIKNPISLSLINMLKKVFSKNIELHYLSLKDDINIFLYSFLFWILLSAGFYFLVESMIDTSNISILYMFSFSIAAALGILTLFAPGGLGVREMILATILINYGFTSQEAISISVASRVWFLINEFILFFIGISSSKFSRGKEVIK